MAARNTVSPIPGPQARVWTDALKDRINKPPCGCPQHFDPLQLRVTTRCQPEVTPLLYLCRTIILRLLGLHRLNKGLQLLPIPQPLAQFVCRLKFRDFFISPSHVQTENILRGVYPATLEFARLPVILRVRRCPLSRTGNHDTHAVSSEDASNPAFVMSFQEGKTQCGVYWPRVRLMTILNTCRRTGTAMDTTFVKRATQAMGRYVIDTEEMIRTCLTPDCVAVTANGIIYVDPDSHWDLFPVHLGDKDKYTAPEVLTKHFPISREKALVWSIGSIIEEMISTYSQTPKLLPPTKHSQPSSMTRRGRGSKRIPGTHRPDANDYYNAKKMDSCGIRNSLMDLAKQCLNKDPFLRPKAKQIILCLSLHNHYL